MSRFLAIVAATLAIAAIAALPSSAAAKTCGSGYVHAVIGGKQKCLRRGEYCSHRYGKQYHKYGFNCVRKHGEYFLEPRH